MSAFRSPMKDSVLIVKSDGRRLGPYQAVVSPDSIIIMEKAIDVDEGDHVARPIPSGKEELYWILSADYSQGSRTIPPFYELKVRKTTVQSPRLSMANKIEPVSAIKNEPLFQDELSYLVWLSVDNFPLRA